MGQYCCPITVPDLARNPGIPQAGRIGRIAACAAVRLAPDVGSPAPTGNTGCGQIRRAIGQMPKARARPARNLRSALAAKSG